MSLPTFTHVTLSSCQLPVGDSDATGKGQLAAVLPGTITCPPLLLLASLIKLGRSDCHWEIAGLQLSYSLCENSFTLARFSFFFMPAQMPYISVHPNPLAIP